MSKIKYRDVDPNNASLFFAYRRVLGLEMKRREKQTVYIEKEFLEMFPPGALSDITNQALNHYAVMHGYVEEG